MAACVTGGAKAKNNDMMRICFVRHGETDWNIEQRFQGQIDLALNANGQQQASALGRSFLGRSADALYSSDLLRARETAEPIGEVLSLPVITRQALRERHFGRCEGLTLDEIALRYPDDAQAIACHDPDYASPGGESRRQHQERILNFVDSLATIHFGQTIVLVTHGGALDIVYRRARNLPTHSPRDYPIPNAGINWISIEDERWLIESWGDTAHLD